MGDDDSGLTGSDDARNASDDVIGSSSLRPIFLGNLTPGYKTEDVIDIFERPIAPPQSSRKYGTIPVDRIDHKRGYCFVFLKDVSTQAEKEQAESFVKDIQGM